MGRGQDRPQENPPLTYYDDLGVPASASGEEIREAYLNLVRTLHPNLQHEPSLKRYAEVQMKRISRAYAVLSDDQRRRRYDADSALAFEPPTPASSRRNAGRSRARAWITLGWLICAFAGSIGIGWYMSQQSGAPPAPSEVKAAPAARVVTPAVQAPAVPVSSAAAQSAQEQPGSASTAAPPLTGAPPGSLQPGSVQASDPADLSSLPTELAAAKAERDRALFQIELKNKELDFLTNRIIAAPKAQKGFGGVWVLPKSSGVLPNSSYAPASADLIVTENAGLLEGRFRARYPTMGRTEPTIVHFYFEGKPETNVANLNWTGDGGAKGDIQLRLISQNSLELVWSATEMGREAGPGSGTVLLLRKREP